VKHPSLNGWRLLLVQPRTADGKEDGEPLLAVDNLGAGPGSRVILTNDGASARELVGAKNSPVRWMVLGLCD
jgi:ethanolamine utilization protein EutN